MTDYERELAFVLSLPDWERYPSPRPARQQVLLERPAALLKALGNPQTRFKSVLVAGTKGKGSTAAMLAEILRSAGYKIGLYTQPHLHSYRERIRINGQPIDPQKFASGIRWMRPLLERLCAENGEFQSFTTFEVMTALALSYFASRGVEIAVLEVGLGGRLDATNVVNADLAIVTPISLDHTRVLGNTVEKIANEKAGIIKEGKPVLSAPQKDPVAEVLRAASEHKQAPIAFGDKDWIWLGDHASLLVAGTPVQGIFEGHWQYPDMGVPLLGCHQLENAALAVAAVEALRARLGIKVSEAAVREGLRTTTWHGRMEILQTADKTRPWIVADGAHNGESAERLVAALRYHFQFEWVYLVLGVLGDKDLQAIAAPFVPLTPQAWTFSTRHPRSKAAEQTAEVLTSLGLPAMPMPSLEMAIKQAQQRAGPYDLICVTGSLSSAAEARELFGRVGAEEIDSLGWGVRLASTDGSLSPV